MMLSVKLKYSEINPSQSHSVHQNTHTESPGVEPKPPLSLFSSHTRNNNGVMSEVTVIQLQLNSFNLAPVGRDGHWIIKYSTLLKSIYTDLSSYR